ncbi:glucosaminidase domain-containing protein [Marinomonas colpomeniae]|uniref:Glucosaminidase domain-containing protein n=1 Tax=Marinomonas colpomeniae TaxID=2774408 RepID=A0ABR8NUR8_9GAMM|nr:glucosaminidase domain-containing protein [Marinomonas colpomeniae]MBD5769784.1 glucosaminidase domain-containing protein [Marinomonas colpomeniae]
MKKKILWTVYPILILIILSSFISYQSEKNQDNNSIDDYQSENEASPYEKSYFKSHPIDATPPNFKSITDIKERKKTFFNYLAQFVYEKNTLILKDRERILALIDNNKKLSKKNKVWISTLRKSHKLKTLNNYSKDDLRELLDHVDVVPASLALAQAANESAWGTSRFATKGNNFFGQWCFKKGCGLVPESRDIDADHEVRKFHDVRESVFAYIDNLNSNNAYKTLRASRSNLRQNQESITGLSLTNGLINYSERGLAYIEEIEGLINYNKLWRFNNHEEN